MSSILGINKNIDERYIFNISKMNLINKTTNHHLTNANNEKISDKANISNKHNYDFTQPKQLNQCNKNNKNINDKYKFLKNKEIQHLKIFSFFCSFIYLMCIIILKIILNNVDILFIIYMTLFPISFLIFLLILNINTKSLSQHKLEKISLLKFIELNRPRIIALTYTQYFIFMYFIEFFILLLSNKYDIRSDKAIYLYSNRLFELKTKTYFFIFFRLIKNKILNLFILNLAQLFYLIPYALFFTDYSLFISLISNLIICYLFSEVKEKQKVAYRLRKWYNIMFDSLIENYENNLDFLGIGHIIFKNQNFLYSNLNEENPIKAKTNANLLSDNQIERNINERLLKVETAAFNKNSNPNLLNLKSNVNTNKNHHNHNSFKKNYGDSITEVSPNLNQNFYISNYNYLNYNFMIKKNSSIKRNSGSKNNESEEKNIKRANYKKDINDLDSLNFSNENTREIIKDIKFKKNFNITNTFNDMMEKDKEKAASILVSNHFSKNSHSIPKDLGNQNFNMRALSNKHFDKEKLFKKRNFIKPSPKSIFCNKDSKTLSEAPLRGFSSLFNPGLFKAENLNAKAFQKSNRSIIDSINTESRFIKNNMNVNTEKSPSNFLVSKDTNTKHNYNSRKDFKDVIREGNLIMNSNLNEQDYSCYSIYKNKEFLKQRSSANSNSKYEKNETKVISNNDFININNNNIPSGSINFRNYFMRNTHSNSTNNNNNNNLNNFNSNNIKNLENLIPSKIFNNDNSRHLIRNPSLNKLETHKTPFMPSINSNRNNDNNNISRIRQDVKFSRCVENFLEPQLTKDEDIFNTKTIVKIDKAQNKFFFHSMDFYNTNQKMLLKSKELRNKHLSISSFLEALIKVTQNDVFKSTDINNEKKPINQENSLKYYLNQFFTKEKQLLLDQEQATYSNSLPKKLESNKNISQNKKHSNLNPNIHINTNTNENKQESKEEILTNICTENKTGNLKVKKSQLEQIFNDSHIEIKNNGSNIFNNEELKILFENFKDDNAEKNINMNKLNNIEAKNLKFIENSHYSSSNLQSNSEISIINSEVRILGKNSIQSITPDAKASNIALNTLKIKKSNDFLGFESLNNEDNITHSNNLKKKNLNENILNTNNNLTSNRLGLGLTNMGSKKSQIFGFCNTFADNKNLNQPQLQRNSTKFIEMNDVPKATAKETQQKNLCKDKEENKTEKFFIQDSSPNNVFTSNNLLKSKINSITECNNSKLDIPNKLKNQENKSSSSSGEYNFQDDRNFKSEDVEYFNLGIFKFRNMDMENDFEKKKRFSTLFRNKKITFKDSQFVNAPVIKLEDTANMQDPHGENKIKENLRYFTQNSKFQITLAKHKFGNNFIYEIFLKYLDKSPITSSLIEKSNVSNNQISKEKLLEEVEASKQEFATELKKNMAKIIHEFKTPINTIISLISEINCLQNLNTNKSYRTLSLINNISNYLVFLTKDIVQFCNIGAGKNTGVNLDITTQPVQLKEIIHFCFDILNTLLFCKESKSNVKSILNFDENISEYTIVSDELRLKQIILNFISNAIKFTKSGSIVLDCKLVNPRQIKISVSDTGIGIRDEDKEKLFNDFVMLKDNLKLNIQGSGLGLSICRLLANKLNHTINFESTYGEGSNFSIILKGVKKYEKMFTQSKVGHIMIPNRTKTRLRRYKTCYKIFENRHLEFDESSNNNNIYSTGSDRNNLTNNEDNTITLINSNNLEINYNLIKTNRSSSWKYINNHNSNNINNNNYLNRNNNFQARNNTLNESLTDRSFSNSFIIRNFIKLRGYFYSKEKHNQNTNNYNNSNANLHNNRMSIMSSPYKSYDNFGNKKRMNNYTSCKNNISYNMLSGGSDYKEKEFTNNASNTHRYKKAKNKSLPKQILYNPTSATVDNKFQTKISKDYILIFF